MENLLEIRNVYKYYGNFAANEGINLDVKKGEIHSIIGENGAGKSTLMNILSGVIKPTSGEIYLNGKKIELQNPNDATKVGIGMVQQEFMLFDELSVLENIVIGYEDTNRFSALNLKESERKVKKICEEYHFSFPLHKKVKSLPIALQQQVEIVKVLFKNANIIILDEPTAVLTPQGIEGLFRAMKFLVEQGKTIIFITHKLNEVLRISDQITVLKNGKLIDTIRNQNITKSMLAKMMVGREVFLEVNKANIKSENEVLKVDDLYVNDDREVVKVNGVSFSLKEGEVLGIVGIAGNGQTELVEAITGLRKYKFGRITFQGELLKQNNPKENHLKKIGYIPQDRINTGSSIQSSLVDNLIMGKHLTSFSNKLGVLDFTSTNDYSKSVLERYDVRNQGLFTLGGSLSGGNLQKLIVGREFSQENKVLIIEDPTRGIDIGSMEFIWKEIITGVENKNSAVLLITYDLNEAMSLSDRILVLYEGKFVKELSRSEFDEKVIGLFMLGGQEDEVSK